ncbi:MAG: DUF4142 domain-containing protein [Polyangiaceae bacterium]
MTPRATGCAGVILSLALCNCVRGTTTTVQPTNAGALGGPGATDADDTAPTHVRPEDPTVVSTVTSPPGAAGAPLDESDAGRSPSSPAADKGPGLSNEQIFQIARTANAGQIRQAELAHQMSKDTRVQKLAATLIRDHRVAENNGDSVAHKHALLGEPSPQSVKIEEASQRATKALRAQQGLEFDKSYVDTEVSEHQALLDMLSSTLIPGSTRSDLTGYLREVKAADEAELAQARALRAELER